MNRIRRLRQEEGFTLIELLIVIIILGILVAIVIFGVTTFREQAVQEACNSDEKQVETAASAYLAKFDTDPPSIDALVTAKLIRSNPNDEQQNYDITFDADGEPQFATCVLTP